MSRNLLIHLLLLVVLVMSGTTLCGYGLELTDDEKEFIRLHPVVKAHNSLEYIPYNYFRNGRAEGYSIDYLNLIADKLGITVDYISGPSWNQFTTMLKNREIDVMTDISVTDDRKKIALFTPPLLVNTPSIICKKDSKFSSLDGLSGRVVAVVEGHWYYDIIKKYFPDIVVVSARNSLDAIKEVSYGNVDAVIGNGTVCEYLWLENNITNLKKSGEAILPCNELSSECIAVRSDWTLMHSAITKAMNDVTLKEELTLKEKWLSFKRKNVALKLSDEEIDYLMAKGSITMCVDPEFLPYEGIENNKHIGIAADFFSEFQSMLPVPVTLVQTENWAESVNYVKENKCDIVSLLNKSPERGRFLNFTDPYLSDPIVIIARDDVFYLDGIKSLSGRSVAVTEGYYMYDVLRRNFPDVKLICASSPKEALKLVSEGKAFANITSILAGTRAIQYYGFSNLKVAGQTELRNNFRVGVSKSEPILCSIMNKAVNSVERKTSNMILQHWYTVGFQHKTDWRVVWQVGSVAMICVVLLLYNIVSSRRYGRKIMESNIKLQNQNNKLNDLKAELEINVKKLNKLAVTDKLTGLYNRVRIDAVLTKEFRRSARYGAYFGVILADIDHFKDINDTFGHQTGDEILVKVSRLIKDNTRDSDVVGRWGGEEFIIICPETTTMGLMDIAEKLRRRIEETDFQQISSLTASFGVSLSKLTGDDNVTQLISRADKALYQAKQTGRNRVKSG